MSPAVRDTGLQVERTELAWARTAMTVLANALLTLRFGWNSQSADLVALGMVLILGAAAMSWVGLRRHRDLLDATAPGVAHEGAVAAVATIAAAAAAVGLWGVIELY
jgi:hypothetical protein